MKTKKLTLEVLAYILDESLEWIKFNIDNNKFYPFAYKKENGNYYINKKLFERYLLSSKPYFLKVHGSTRRYR